MKNKKLYLASFLVPVIAILGYFAMMQFWPFESKTVLTIDLGQQYIDFLAYFKDALASENGILYSFSNGIGGSMIGNWAYYLMSPLNFLALLVDKKDLPQLVSILTLIRYGLASLSFAYASRKVFTKIPNIWIFSGGLFYAFNSYLIANQLNIIWLDSYIMLPLVILGIYKIFRNQGWYFYTFTIFLAVIFNYYIGYMIALFSILFFIWSFISDRQKFNQKVKYIWQFVGGSLLSVGLSAVLVVPLVLSLLDSKLNYTVIKPFDDLLNFKPQDLMAKNIAGAFDNNQISFGLPNIFVATIVIFGFLFYFLNRNIRLLEKILTLFITIILLGSIVIKPANLFWHGMQDPVWYLYRFSFLFIFWIIWIGMSNLNAGYRLRWWAIGLVSIVIMAELAYLSLNLKNYSFLDNTLIYFAVGVTLATAIILLISIKHPRFLWILAPVILLEVGFNYYQTIDAFDYTDINDYRNFRAATVNTLNKMPAEYKGFYRVFKTFKRSNDDALQLNLKSASVFSSALNKQQKDFFLNVGADNNIAAINYLADNPAVNSFLDGKYIITTQDKATDKIVNDDSLLTKRKFYTGEGIRKIHANKYESIYQNEFAWPVGFFVTDNMQKLNLDDYYPAQAQNRLFKAAGAKDDLYVPDNFNGVQATKMETTMTPTDAHLKSPKKEKSSIEFMIQPTLGKSSYITFGSEMDSQNMSISINGKPLNRYNDAVELVQITDGSSLTPINIKIVPHKKKIELRNFVVYSFDNQAFIKLSKKIQNEAPKIKQVGNTKLSFNTNETKKRKLMFSIPADKGWHLTKDGREIQIEKGANTFILANISSGKHYYELTYRTPGLMIGLIISIISGVIIIYLMIRRTIKNRRS